jgi:hypothetical protein
MSIKICLQNTKGLSADKLKKCIKLLDKHITDLIIITETWQFSDYHLCTPYLVAKSIPIPRSRLVVQVPMAAKSALSIGEPLSIIINSPFSIEVQY